MTACGGLGGSANCPRGIWLGAPHRRRRKSGGGGAVAGLGAVAGARGRWRRCVCGGQQRAVGRLVGVRPAAGASASTGGGGLAASAVCAAGAASAAEQAFAFASAGGCVGRARTAIRGTSVRSRATAPRRFCGVQPIHSVTRAAAAVGRICSSLGTRQASGRWETRVMTPGGGGGWQPRGAVSGSSFLPRRPARASSTAAYDGSTTQK